MQPFIHYYKGMKKFPGPTRINLNPGSEGNWISHSVWTWHGSQLPKENTVASSTKRTAIIAPHLAVAFVRYKTASIATTRQKWCKTKVRMWRGKWLDVSVVVTSSACLKKDMFTAELATLSQEFRLVGEQRNTKINFRWQANVKRWLPIRLI